MERRAGREHILDADDAEIIHSISPRRNVRPAAMGQLPPCENLPGIRKRIKLFLEK